MTTLTRVSNPPVKAARALKTHKARHESGLHLAEGPKALSELLAFNIPVERAFCLEEFIAEHSESLAQTGAEVFCVSENVLEALSDTRAPQGAVFAVQTPAAAAAPHSGLALALDGVQDPGNLGTLLRAADAFGASFVLLGEGCTEPFSPKAVRASAFSCYHLPIRQSTSLLDDLTALKAEGFTLLAADVHGEEGFPALQESVLVVAGSEGCGLRGEIADICARVRLRMPGRAESLNVALAAGIFLYEVSRRLHP